MPIEFLPDKDFNDKQEFEINEETMKSFETELTKMLMNSIKEEILQDVIPSLGPQNFRGEAITYMKQNNIPLTELGIPGVKGVNEPVFGIKQYSILMLKGFIDNVDALVIYDEKENEMLISPFIMALEYGDFYRPVLKTITRAIEQAFAELS